MKCAFAVYIAGIILVFAGCHNRRNANVNNAATDKKLEGLLNQKEYFRLEAQLSLLGDSINDEQKLYYRAFIDNAFNRNKESIKDADALLKEHFSKLSDSSKAALQLLQEDSYFKLFQYARSAGKDSTVLSNYSGALDSEKLSDIKNHLLIRNALKSVPPQETIIKDNETMYWKKDKIGLIEIPLKCRAVSYNGIFDTRANISSITQTYAGKLGLKILDVSYEEGSGITGIKFKTGLGIADSLYIGNILVRNVVFQVMPDSILYIAPIKFSLNIIIGFPVIAQLKEIHLYRDGRMSVPLRVSESELHNFALDGLDPVVSLKSDQDTLCFHLDLGADETILYAAYFEKFKQKILTSGYKRSAQFGGAGGIQAKDVYVLPALHLSMGNKDLTLDSVDVFTKKVFPEERFYGNLGRDFSGKFDELILNFEYMYIRGT